MSTNSFYHLECIACHKKVSERVTTSLCPFCNGPLDVVYDFDYLKNQVNQYVLRTASPKVVKYLDLLPLYHREDIVTLEEGGTPLHLSKNLGKKMGLTNLFIKNEGLNPTGAFKDRGSFVEINKARELGYKAIVVASTGNMAASVAAFSVQAGLPCYVFVPDNTPRGKLAQCLSYDAKVIQVRGTYTDATKIAERTAQKYGFYLAGDYAFRIEGQKTLAYEVIEQSFLKPIDWVIVPMGMGTNIAAIWKGFTEYYKLGLLKRLPKIIGVQAQGCSPIVDAFAKKKRTITPVEKPQTVSSAIAVGNPIDAPKALNAIRSSDGLALAVSDDKTLQAQQILARHEGIYVEPAAATSIAAVIQLSQEQKFKADDRIVCVTTGAGLKDTATTLRVLAEPPVIEPTIEEVDRVIKGKLFSIRSSGMVDEKKVLFDRVPKETTLKKVLQDEFDIEPDDYDLKHILKELEEFREKGKDVTKADLQAIIETAIQHGGKKYLDVLDFTITDTKHDPSQAWLQVKIEGKVFEAQASGVGPVDAAINALQKELSKNGHTKVRLMDFNVEVSAAGTDASVVVTLVMQDEKGNEVVVRQTSPDIILASIEAFERGYNELAGRKKK